MKVKNIHCRTYPVNKSLIWDQIEKLSSKEDGIWPYENWPRMIMRPNLSVGAIGGHGPIRYFIESIKIQESITFRFTNPKGFDGIHFLKIDQIGNQTKLSHQILMDTSIKAYFSWLFIVRPLHDALIEDAFTKLEATIGSQITVITWSLWVKILRYFLKS
ncbi:MAG: hypothetical protein SH817_06990 [Leptospira sp.]|nr:hypothetical protein [Leptospira sp.]